MRFSQGRPLLDVTHRNLEVSEQRFIGVRGEHRAVVRDDASRPAILSQGGGQELQDGDGVLIFGGHARQDLARVALDEAQGISPVVAAESGGIVRDVIVIHGIWGVMGVDAHEVANMGARRGRSLFPACLQNWT
jgi:hypothetical protein